MRCKNCYNSRADVRWVLFPEHQDPFHRTYLCKNCQAQIPTFATKSEAIAHLVTIKLTQP